ncbi:MAG: hypothetical protein AB7P03_21195 [Kofleriaceae bacterium]
MSATDRDQRTNAASAPAAAPRGPSHGQAPGRGTLTGALPRRRPKPSPGHQPKHAEEHDAGEQALNGAPFQWIPDTLQFRVDTRWFCSASDFSENDGEWRSPSRIFELLMVLRTNKLLSWTTPERLAAASHHLAVTGGAASVTLISLQTTAFEALGLPPGTNALVGRRADRGLDVVITVSAIDAEEGQAFLVSQPLKLQLLSSIEQFTQLPINPAGKVAFLAMKLMARLGARVAWFPFRVEACHDLFGKDAYETWFTAQERAGTNMASEVEPGIAGTAELTPEEIAYVRGWIAEHVRSDAAGARPVAMTRGVANAIYRIEALEPPVRDRVLQSLRATGGDSAMLTSDILVRAINDAEFSEERARAGFEPGDHGPGVQSLVFDYPIPARIDQRSGKVVSGETVDLTIEIDWPPAYTGAEQLQYLWRQHRATIDWMFERTFPGGGRLEQRKHSVVDGKHNGQLDHVFDLRPGEAEAVWTVHAFVRNNYFQPRHLITQVEVKTEAKRLEESRAQAFASLGQHDIDEADHDFDTSLFNETFGQRKYDRGKQFRGELPEGFAQRTPAEQKAAIDRDIETTTQMLGYLKGNETREAAHAAAERHIAKLKASRDAIDVDARQGWQSFEVRGTYLSRGRYADGALDLLGAVKYEKAYDHPAAFSYVTVQLRDLSRRFGSDSFRFTGTGVSFEQALERAFVDLCKKYPDGTLSILAERLHDAGAIRTGKTVGFELDTGTAWESTKQFVFSPVIDIAMAVGGVLAIVFPPAAAAMLPLTLVYSSAKNLDSLVDEMDSGTLTGTKVGLHIAQLATDVMPVIGKAKVFSTSKLAFKAFDIAGQAGSTLLMSAQTVETIRTLRDGQIHQLAGVYAQYIELERSTHASDPRLATLRAEIDKGAAEVRRTAVAEWTKAAAQHGVVMVSTKVAQAIDGNLKSKQLAELLESRQLRLKDGVEAHYDTRTGQIVASDMVDRATLDRLTKQQATHIQAMATQLATDLGIAPDRVTAQVGSTTQLWNDHKQIQLRYAPGTDPAEALRMWRAEAVARKLNADEN